MKCPTCNGAGSVGPAVQWKRHDCAQEYRTREKFTTTHGDYIYAIVQDGEPDEDDIGWYVVRAFSDDIPRPDLLGKSGYYRGKILASMLANRVEAELAACGDMVEPKGPSKANRDNVRKLEAKLAEAKRRMAK